MSDIPLLPLTAAGLGVVGLSALPAIFAILAQLRNRTPKDNFYQDVDGKSTPQIIAAFSTRLPKTLILSLSTIGLGTSIAVALLSTLQHSQHGLFLENWLSTASWVSTITLVLGVNNLTW